MGPMIDRANGTIRLAEDLILTPGLKHEKIGNYINPAERTQLAKSHWITPFTVPSMYGVLEISLHFRKGILVALRGSIKSEFGPAQAMIKGRHDGFLTELLGRPTHEKPVISSLMDKVFLKGLGQDWPRNLKVLTWDYRWGSVESGVELRDGIAEFRVNWK